MKIMLIAPPVMDYSLGNAGGVLKPIAMDATHTCPPYGIYLLATILESHGYEAIVVDLVAEGINSIESHQKILKSCDLVTIGATSLSWPTALDIVFQIRKIAPDILIELGGIHPTMFDSYILKNYPVDYIIRGEAERALPILCKAIENKSSLYEVPNLSWKSHRNTITKNALAKKMTGEELGRFPIPNYSILPRGVYQSLSLESSRGCKFDCAFCSTSYRRTWRAIPATIFVERLAETMKYIDKVQFKTLQIIDDEFTLDVERVIEIAKLLHKNNLKPSLIYNSRATDLISDQLVDNLAEFTRQLLVGAECGYEDGLQRVGKGTSCGILEEAAKKLNTFGIADKADFSFILGLPWETRNEINQTINFATHLHIKYGVRILLQWYCQIPGSRIWEEFRKNEVVDETMYDYYGFFRNLYLFRSGVNVLPSEVFEISKVISDLQKISKIRWGNYPTIEYSIPETISENYLGLLNDQNDLSGLKSLREVAQA